MSEYPVRTTVGTRIEFLCEKCHASLPDLNAVHECPHPEDKEG